MEGSPILEAGFRNKLESGIGTQLDKHGISFGYEKIKLGVEFPPRTGKYTPDFSFPKSPIIIESKGYFYNKAADRQKLILVKQQHPHLDIRLVFQNARTAIYKGSKTTYGKWADDHGFKWADKGVIPFAWIKEIQAAQKGN